MTRNLHLSILTAILAIAIFPASNSSAQTPDCYCDQNHWQLLSSSNAYLFPSYTPYFINEQIGFVFEKAGNFSHDKLYSRLFRTKDGGASWEQCLSTSYLGAISQMCFVTVAHGYAATTYPVGVNAGGIYESTDTGYSWHRISNDTGSYYRVIATGSKVIAIGGVDGSHLVSRIYGDTAWKAQTITNFLTGAQRGSDAYYLENLCSNGENFCVADGSVASADGGSGWVAYPPGPVKYPYGTLYCIPHRHTIFQQSNQIILRNSELSSKWDTVLKGYYIPLKYEIEGAGCAVYLATSSGQVKEGNNQYELSGTLARTTDLGQNWATISAPPFTNNNHFCVVGNGAVIYFVTGTGYVYKSTDGGDGALSKANDVHQIQLSHTNPLSAVNDTLFTSLCDTTNFTLHFQYTGSCAFGWLDHVRIDGLDTNEYRSVQTHHVPSENKPDTSWTTISPVRSGMRRLVVHATYTNDDREALDTSFIVNLSVAHNLSALSIIPLGTINLGSQSLNNPKTVRDSFTVSAKGCEAVDVDSIIFIADVPSNNDFRFTKVQHFTASPSGTTIYVGFKPSRAGTEHGTILIYSFDGVTRRVDTIRVVGSGLLFDQVSESSAGVRFTAVGPYPNPSRSKINPPHILARGVKPDETISILVLDMLGKQVGKSIRVTLSGLDWNRIELPMPLPSGIYRIRVSTGDDVSILNLSVE